MADWAQDQIHGAIGAAMGGLSENVNAVAERLEGYLETDGASRLKEILQEMRGGLEWMAATVTVAS